jgi:hypothetical protein
VESWCGSDSKNEEKMNVEQTNSCLFVADDDDTLVGPNE